MKKVVSATLAGALAVGMVPAMAFAAEGDQELELLAQVDADDNFNDGKVVEALANGKVVEMPAKGNYKVDFTGDEQTFVPTKVVLGDGVTEIDITETDAEGNALYKVNVAKTKATDAGVYTINVKPTVYNEDFSDTCVIKVKWEIEALDLDDAFVFEGDDKSDDAFTYLGGETIDVKFGVDDVVLEDGVDGISIAITDAKGTSVTDIKDAGKYNAIIKATSGNYDGGDVLVTFTVDALDLSDYAFPFTDLAFTTGVIKDAGDLTIPNIYIPTYAGALNAHAISSNDVRVTVDPADIYNKGEYEVTLTAVKATDADYNPAAKQLNYTGSATANFTVVDTVIDASGFCYGKKSVKLAAALNGQTFDASATDYVPFDPEKVLVYNGSAKLVYGTDYTVTVTKDGAAVSSYDVPGTYNVKVDVVTDSDYTLGGTQSATFVVTNGDSTETSAYVYYNGEPVGSSATINVDYTGENLIDGFSALVKDGKETLVEGVDYKIVFKKGGKEVTEIKDVLATGTYKMVIDYITYSGSDDEFDIVVNPIDMVGYTFVPNTVGTLTYTGEAIAPAFLYTTKFETDPAKTVWTALPDIYTVTYKYSKDGNAPWTTVKEVKAEGFYKATIAKKADALNYSDASVADKVVEFQVSSKTPFSDVPAGAWYAGVVNRAADLGFMGGYAGTQFFGPNDTLTRAQLVCVLYNIATNGYNASLDEGTNGIIDAEYESFKDVASNKFYSAAIYWAKQTGVVNGYDDGTFKPEKAVSREEAAAMFANFAKVQGEKASAADAAVLAGYPDGAKVSAWAKDSVAWAVDNGIMGNGKTLNPKSDILRAEAAAYAVNYYNAFIA